MHEKETRLNQTVDPQRAKWIQFMRDQNMEISKEEAEKLMESNIGTMFDFDDFGGYFSSENPKDTRILLIIDEGYFLRDQKYLVTSEDGVLVNWVELLDLETLTGERPTPNFGDIFEVKEF